MWPFLILIPITECSKRRAFVISEIKACGPYDGVGKRCQDVTSCEQRITVLYTYTARSGPKGQGPDGDVNNDREPMM